VITWALGHLVHFAEPDEYGPQWSGRWAASQLPMIPGNCSPPYKSNSPVRAI